MYLQREKRGGGYKVYCKYKKKKKWVTKYRGYLSIKEIENYLFLKNEKNKNAHAT